MDIRITETPPGKAPEWVRRAWVGLVLPLVVGEHGPRFLATAGVLTGPQGCGAALLHLLLGRSSRRIGYVIDAQLAVWLLAEKNPEAADWWRENAPHVLRAGHRFVFPEEVCREEGRGAGRRRRPPRGGEGITR